MDNQHKKIKGYRDLSQDEIDLMNRIKAKGEELRDLVNDLGSRAEINIQIFESRPYEHDHFDKLRSAKQALRWVKIGEDHLQQGVMALVRSVARPESF